MSEEALALFRAVGAHRPPAQNTPEVHVWTGRRLERQVNPFERGDVHHIVGASRELDRGGISSVVEHLAGRDWIHLERLIAPDARREVFLATRSDEKSSLMVSFARFLDEQQTVAYVRDGMLLVLDELFTNAIYNAPIIRGVRANSVLHRSEVADSPRP